jgi:hypothetical protein
MRVALDPAVLHAPNSDPLAWLAHVRATDALVSDLPAVVACPGSLQARAQSDWWVRRDAIEAELSRLGVPLTHADLVRVAEQLRSRLHTDVLPGHIAMEVAEIAAEPAYVAPQVEGPARDEFLEVLALLAALKDQDGVDAAILTMNSSWASHADHVWIDTQIAARIVLEEDGSELEELGVSMREALALWSSPDDAAQAMFNHAPGLLLAQCPTLGVRCAHVADGGTLQDLEFAIATSFASSIARMGYRNLPGRAATCLRTMARIAAGGVDRMPGLQAHPQREGVGPRERPVTDEEDRVLMRGYLANRTANAHRLFWWSGANASVEFVGVAGHDDDPPS